MLRTLCCLVLLAIAAPARLAHAAPSSLTLGFDGLADLGTNLDAFGVSFSGATVLACGGSLNCGQFPPFSGRNVIYDTTGGSGVIRATFDRAQTGPVTTVSARVTGNRNITMTAFSEAGQALASDQTGGANYASVGTPNKLLAVTTAEPIAYVTFHDSGNTYTIDDFTFVAEPKLVVLDPGHGKLLADDLVTLHYQRLASPTHGLHEDDLTPQIARAAGTQLLDEGYTVYYTRLSEKAPISELGIACGQSPGGDNGYNERPFDYCNADLKLRVEMIRLIDADPDADVTLVTSVHTNGSDLPLIGRLRNGTEAFYCRSADSALASGLVREVIELGTSDLGTHVDCTKAILRRMSDDGISNALIEVAYHSNSFKVSGPTDEDRLNSPAFRSDAGKAIATAIGEALESEGNP